MRANTYILAIKYGIKYMCLTEAGRLGHEVSASPCRCVSARPGDTTATRFQRRDIGISNEKTVGNRVRCRCHRVSDLRVHSGVWRGWRAFCRRNEFRAGPGGAWRRNSWLVQSDAHSATDARPSGRSTAAHGRGLQQQHKLTVGGRREADVRSFRHSIGTSDTGDEMTVQRTGAFGASWKPLFIAGHARGGCDVLS